MVFAAAVAQAACIPLLPIQLAGAGMGFLGIGLIMAAATLGAIGFRLAGRNHLDALSVAWWMRIGLLAIAVALAGYAELEPDLRFGVFRFLQGMGFGAVTISAMVWAAQRSSAEERSLIFAVIGGAIGLGIISGPPFAVVIKTTCSLPLAYLSTAFVAVIAGTAPLRGNDRIQVSPTKRFAPGGATIAAGTVCFLNGAGIGLMEAFVPIIVTREHIAGLPVIISIFGFLSVAGRFIPSSLRRHLSMRSILVLSSIASALGLVAMIWSMQSTISAIVCSALLGAALGAATNAAISFASLGTETSDQASAMAVVGISADAGVGVGAVIGGGSLAVTGDWSAGLAVIAASLVIVGIVLGRRAMRPLWKRPALGDKA